MKLRKFAVANLLCMTMMSATAQTYQNNIPSGDSSDEKTTKILQAVINWAALIGLKIDPSEVKTTPTIANVTLIDPANASLLETLVYSTFFGSIPTATPPVTSANSSSSGNQGQGFPFMPSQIQNAEVINAASNLTFKNYANSGTAQSGGQLATIQGNKLVDQQPIQADPISQSLFNILGTPDVSACSTSTNMQTPQIGVLNSTNPLTQFNTEPCPIAPTMFQSQVMQNVIGIPPDQNSFYKIENNAALLPQLNSNSLIAPLNYSAEALNFNTGNNKNAQTGLTASTQAELAANFIRYVSGSVTPTILPNVNIYQSVYSKATTPGTQQAQMQAILNTYLTNLRVYAAQSSVGIGNLYYILSRRLPQQQQSGDNSGSGGSSSGSQSQPMSQALNEYNMATWRIFQTPATGGSGGTGRGSASGGTGGSSEPQQWIEKINSASPATVQKEIAILLAEMNYQLYLNRQIQERLLMTSSVSLIQGTKATQPTSDLSNQITAAATTQPSGGQ